ncbi:MAG TPA: CHASE domain-containing protein [Thermoanaerobaculia bacterium]|nr:CHASE domain-containing protein [Thermoanaerobaculia bacterium]
MTPLPTRGDRALAWLVLTAFLALTLLVTYYIWSTSSAADRARFDNAVQTTRDAIDARIESYVNVVIATRGLAVSNPAISRNELRSYIRGLNLRHRYPGIQGIGFSLRVPREELPLLVNEMRRESAPRFYVWPFVDRAEYQPVVFLEPFDRDNIRILGYDMMTSPARLAAMERARDTGRAFATGRVRLVHESDPTREAGFLIYTPLYSTGPTPATRAERRAALVGFIYAPFRAADVFEGLFPSQQRPELGFEIRDAGGFLYRTPGLPDDARYTVRDQLRVAGRTWTIEWVSYRHAGGGVELLTIGTLLGGIAISVLLFLLIRTQLHARAAAEQTAERLRESEAELQRANRAKDEFLATLSHELRTPMTSIMGWAQMLRDTDIEPETTRSGIEAIGKSAKVQAQLIDDLLDVSRITAGKMNIERKAVELKPVIEAAMETVRGAADAKGVALHTELADEIRVHGDPHRLQQVVWNLISNGVKFTPPGGKVYVVLREEGRDAVIEVRDTGQGIAPAFMPHLFERFRQADSSATRAYTGLGLGLAIVRHLVELHGGTVSAESSGIGRGATFRVRLPRSLSIRHGNIVDASTIERYGTTTAP